MDPASLHGADLAPTMTQDGVVVGTHPCMNPEQALGRRLVVRCFIRGLAHNVQGAWSTRWVAGNTAARAGRQSGGPPRLQ